MSPFGGVLGGGGGDVSPRGTGPVAGGGAAPGGAGGAGTGGGAAAAPGSPATAHYSTGLYEVKRDANDRVNFGPPVEIGPRDTVTIAPIPTNTVNCFYSTASPDAAKFGPRSALAPSAQPRTARVRNLNEIGVYSTVVGEGVTIEVQRG